MAVTRREPELVWCKVPFASFEDPETDPLPAGPVRAELISPP